MMSDRTIPFKPLEGLMILILMAITVGLFITQYYAYAIVLPALLPVLIILARFPQIGYYLFVFLIPFDAYTQLSDAFQFLTFTKFVGLWIFFVVLLYCLVRKKIPFEIKSNLWPALSIFFVLGIVSTLISDYQLESANNLRQLLTAYIFFSLTMFFLSYKSLQRPILITLAISITISSLLSIVGFIFKIPLFAIDVESASLIRGIGGMQDPNMFSSTIIFGFPLLSYWFFSSRRLLEKLFIIALFTINIGAVILTYSRGGAIIALFTLFLIFIGNMHRFRPRYLGFVASLSTVALVATIILVPASYWERQKSISQKTEDSAIGARFSYLVVGWENFKEHPVLGTGPGSFKHVYAKSIYAPAFSYGGTSYERFAHNSYLEVIAGTGILGFSVFLLVIMLALTNFKTAKSNFLLSGKTDMAALVSTYRISFTALLLYFLILSNQYNKYFWICLAVSQILLNHSKNIMAERQSDSVPHI
jgi:O-antigen ligase